MRTTWQTLLRKWLRRKLITMISVEMNCEMRKIFMIEFKSSLKSTSRCLNMLKEQLKTSTRQPLSEQKMQDQ